MESSVGRVQGKLSTLTRNMGGKFSSALGTFGGRLKGFATAGLGFLGIGGLFAVSKAFTSSIEKAREFGDASIQLQRITGLNIDTTSRLVDALDFYGVTVDKVNKLAGMQIKNAGNITKTQKGAAKFQKDYGLTITDSSGRVLDFNKQLLASADFFNNKAIPASQKAAGLAKLYGRSWQDLIPVLALGRKGIEKAQKDAISLSEADLEAITKNKEATRKWNDAIGDLQVKIGIGLLPTITELVTSLTGWVTTHGPEIQQFFKDGVRTAKEVGGAVVGVVSGIKAVWDGIPGPVKDLLIKGLIADRTVKFLFGFSITGIVKDLAGGVVKGVAGGLGNVLVKAGIGKFFVQPVFVTNPGFAAGGAGGAGAAAQKLGPLGLLAGIALPAIVAAVTAEFASQFNADPEKQRLGIEGRLQATTGLDLAAFQNLVVFAEAIPKFIDQINNPTADPNRPSAPVTPQDQREHNRIMQQSQGELVADTRAARDKIEALRISTKTSSDSEIAAFNSVRDKVEAAKVATTTGAGLIVAALGKPKGLSPDERDEFHTLQLKNAATRDAIEAGRIATVSAVGTVRDKIEASRIAQVSKLDAAIVATNTVRDKVEASRIATVSAIGGTNTAVNTVRDRIEAAKIATTTAIGNVPSRIVTAAHSDTDRIVTAIRNNQPKITVTVNRSGSPDDRGGGGVVVRNGSGSPDDRG